MALHSRSQTRSIRWSYWSWRFSTEPRHTCRTNLAGLVKAEAALCVSPSGPFCDDRLCEQTLHHLMNWASWLCIWACLARYWCQSTCCPGFLQNSSPNEPNWAERLYYQLIVKLSEAAAAAAARTVTFRLSLWTKGYKNICCVIACNLSIIACLFSPDRSVHCFLYSTFLQRRFFVIVYNYFKAQLSNLQ